MTINVYEKTRNMIPYEAETTFSRTEERFLKKRRVDYLTTKKFSCVFEARPQHCPEKHYKEMGNIGQVSSSISYITTAFYINVYIHALGTSPNNFINIIFVCTGTVVFHSNKDGLATYLLFYYSNIGASQNTYNCCSLKNSLTESTETRVC